MKTIPITIAYGDGIGPEIMKATLAILDAAGAPLDLAPIEIGKKVYLEGCPTGITEESLKILQERTVFLKAPITTPQGGGFKSLNVTTRRVLGLYANVRPVVSYAPYVATKHHDVDLVVVRENEEDLYGGIEYRHTDDVVTATKLISSSGSAKIIRYAFEYARLHGRKKVTCFTKDNIMKMTDGLFHQIFRDIGKEYPELEQEHWIIDIATAKVADTPELFDVIVVPNLYGDIVSDVAAQVTGSVGLAGSANIGMQAAMFEAIHGSAPDIAGQGKANPSGLLLASVMMLLHLGVRDVATTIHNAWLTTLERGIHTSDIFEEAVSRACVGTEEFTQAVISHLGKVPQELPSVDYAANHSKEEPVKPSKIEESITLSSDQELSKKELVGVDFWCDCDPQEQEVFLKKLQSVAEVQNLALQFVDNRGMLVWPDALSKIFCCRLFRARFRGKQAGEKTAVQEAVTPISLERVVALFEALVQTGLAVVRMEMLYFYDGKPGFTMTQGG